MGRGYLKWKNRQKRLKFKQRKREKWWENRQKDEVHIFDREDGIEGKVLIIFSYSKGSIDCVYELHLSGKNIEEEVKKGYYDDFNLFAGHQRGDIWNDYFLDEKQWPDEKMNERTKNIKKNITSIPYRKNGPAIMIYHDIQKGDRKKILKNRKIFYDIRIFKCLHLLNSFTSYYFYQIPGKLHHDTPDHPAYFAFYGKHQMFSYGFYKNGIEHRENNLPSSHHLHYGCRYKLNGEYHRIGGPAYCDSWPSSIHEMWYVNGKKHRMDGPAILFGYVFDQDLHEEYWIDGVQITDPEKIKKMKGWEIYKEPLTFFEQHGNIKFFQFDFSKILE